MHDARWIALAALTAGISCGARTPLYDPPLDGVGSGSDPGGRGARDDNNTTTGRDDSQSGQSNSTTGTTTGTTTGGSSGSGTSSAAGGSSGTGGSSTSSGAAGTNTTTTGGSGGSSSVGCPSWSVNGELIDDMNDGNRFIPSVNGRTGAWTVYHDETPAPMHPDVTDPFTMDATGDPCRMRAAHVYGGPFSVWGAGFGFGLGNPYNAKAYSGIGFWGRSGGSPMSAQIAFPDKDTALNGGLCDPSLNGGNGCYDHYSARRAFSADWQRYEVRFVELQQLGFGRLGMGFDPTTLFEVQFLIAQNAKFDVWIDDVVFLTR